MHRVPWHQPLVNFVLALEIQRIGTCPSHFIYEIHENKHPKDQDGRRVMRYGTNKGPEVGDA